jgi:hypothetical protein
MWILPLVGYLGVVFGFGFLTLAIGELDTALALLLPHEHVEAQVELTPPYSLRPILSVGAGRRAHGHCEEDPHLSDLRRHWHASPPHCRRPISPRLERAGGRESCCLFVELTPLSDREIDGSNIHSEL